MTGPWRCPVCGGGRSTQRWRVTSAATEQGVDPDRFRPSADRYGETVGQVVTCLDCSHGSLAESPSPEALAAAYGEAADPVSIAEEPGQVETGRRSLALVEQAVAPERLLDVGCWTGSLVAAGAERGWQASGIEPSAWAVSRAQARGLDVRVGDLASLATMAGGFRCVALCDVIEHVLDVRAAVRAAAGALQPGGALYLTTPDAGSAAARLLGARWWSVLPMHVQYFTRASMRRLLIGESLRVVTIRTHPKVFTAAYYAERLGGYSAGLGRTGVAATKRLGVADRLVAPDFRDRMQVVAVKTGG